MKKTLIALFALAGVSYGATTLTGIEAEFTTAPSTADNFYSGDYTFVFTLTEDYTMSDFGTVLAFYCGNAVNDTYGYNAIVLGGSDDSLTLTIGRGKAVDTVGNGAGIDADTTFEFAPAADDKIAFTTTIEKGVTYTLTVTGGDQSMTPTLTWEGGSENAGEDKTSYKGNMNGHESNMVYAVNPGTLVVPEPATASLSLLGLAALMIRRRA